MTTELPEALGLGWDQLTIGDLGIDREDGTRLVDEIHHAFREVAKACVDTRTKGKGQVIITIDIEREGKADVAGAKPVSVTPSVKVKRPGRCRPGSTALLTEKGDLLTQGGRQITLADLFKRIASVDLDKDDDSGPPKSGRDGKDKP